MNRYELMVTEHKERFAQIADGNVFVSADEDQYRKGCESIGVNPNVYGNVQPVMTIRIGYGIVSMYARRELKDPICEMIDGFKKEFSDAFKGDDTGEGFVKDYFAYHIKRHNPESEEELLMLTGVSRDYLNAHDAVRNGLEAAMEEASRQDGPAETQAEEDPESQGDAPAEPESADEPEEIQDDWDAPDDDDAPGLTEPLQSAVAVKWEFVGFDNE